MIYRYDFVYFYLLTTDRKCNVLAIVEFISFYIVFHRFFVFSVSSLQGSLRRVSSVLALPTRHKQQNFYFLFEQIPNSEGICLKIFAFCCFLYIYIVFIAKRLFHLHAHQYTGLGLLPPPLALFPQLKSYQLVEADSHLNTFLPDTAHLLSLHRLHAGQR